MLEKVMYKCPVCKKKTISTFEKLTMLPAKSFDIGDTACSYCHSIITVPSWTIFYQMVVMLIVPLTSLFIAGEVSGKDSVYAGVCVFDILIILVVLLNTVPLVRVE